ncbi:MAG TPA: murein biosynthesis integral membrane protein MurJ [Chloroflexota bacterium]|nr:murein biosynthesis integral membrane protein MurJ [Chloroflexota bacterium]
MLLMLGNLLSRVLGLGREAVVVGLYGLTADSSSFATAATVPTMVFDLLVGGAISAALVPVLSEHAADRPTFGRIVGAFLALAVVAMALAALVLELAAPLVVALLGAAREPELFAETTLLLRIMLPAVLFLGAAGVVQAALQARGRFAYTAISAAGFNAGIIAVGLALGPTHGPPALAVGLVLGAALQLAVQWPGLRDAFRSGLILRPDWRHPAVGRALRLYAPVAAGLVLSQVGIAVDRYLAWTTGDGSIAMMRTATTLVQLPLGLVATALSFAVLPSLSRAADDAEFRGTLSFGVRLALLLMVPMTLGLVVLREPVLRLLFERGAFTPANTVLTGQAFVWYAPQMPFWAVDQLLIFAFYARRDTRTPVLVGVFGTLLYLAVALATVVPLGVFGLILANTLQNSSHCVVMYWLLARRGLGLADQGLASLLARVALASAAAWAVHAAALAVLGPSPPGQVANLAWLAATGAAMTLAALAVLTALRTPELVALADTIRRRAGLPA